jgi:XTP/dITP diphosphohydrolase
LFYLPELGVTMAELPEEKKNEISHRGKAMKDLLAHLKAIAAQDRID